MGLASLIYPRTWVNMPGSTDEELFRHQGVFYARIFSRRRPPKYNDRTKYPDALWIPLYVPVGHYETVADLMRGVRQALREFGQSLTDQEFKFTFDEDAKRVRITIPAFSVLALNPWMVDLLESRTFGENTITYRPFPSWSIFITMNLRCLDWTSTTLFFLGQPKEFRRKSKDYLSSLSPLKPEQTR